MKSTMKNRKRIVALFITILVFVSLLQGCGKKGNETKVILTTGFSKNEIFRIETISCSLPEMMVYLTNTQNQYERVYGDEIWKTNLDGITLEENVKETVLARIARIKTMNLLAKQKDITLSKNETDRVLIAAQEYYDSLNKTEVNTMNLNVNIIIEMYSEYALANKVYNYIIKDINPEISDDEARTITIQHILVKTYTIDANGEMIPYSKKGKSDALLKINSALNRAKNGENFENLMNEFNEDKKSTYSFGIGEVEVDIEKVSFNLGTDEISDIIETAYGYEIIKCINTFNREETDANKVKIVEKKRKEVFNEEYEQFVAKLTKKLNENLWSDVTLIHNPEVITNSFFEVYEEYFE
ncbi:MAG TPA: peptidylprolyl isomerase [Lachnospiraceae bacterium]|nr:peptidylprolyl isomerase [Lachnospiraceae bacterium]